MTGETHSTQLTRYTKEKETPACSKGTRRLELAFRAQQSVPSLLRFDARRLCVFSSWRFLLRYHNSTHHRAIYRNTKKPAPPKEQAFKTDIAPFKPLCYKRKNQSTTTLRAPLAVTTTYTPFESTGIPAFAPP